MLSNRAFMGGVFFYCVAGYCLGRTGNVIDPTIPVSVSTAALAAAPAAPARAATPGAGTMSRPQSFFTAFDPVATYSTLITKSSVERARTKLHNDIDDQLDTVLYAQDAAVPGAAPKAHVIYDACHAYLKSEDAVQTAQDNLNSAAQRYQNDRDNWLRKNPDSAAAFQAAEAAASSDSTKLAMFKSVYLKQANLVNEWSRKQSYTTALSSARNNQGSSWTGLSGGSTLGVNMQGVMTAYASISALVDTAAAARIQVIADATRKGVPVPVPVVDPTLTTVS